ncbi:hypothetical protein DY000_02059204 [Brassica cretica]|uniref:Uncharacterized protein n=1 Tax=Brassica cretica TaxID=69181 RepID=A0ABQ7ASU0_BRACR|nr:hypothetical protein DY000_02059204 [Brassica cretica]
MQQRSLTEKAACSYHRHTPPSTTNKSPSDESFGCGRNCLGACCLNADEVIGFMEMEMSSRGMTSD